MHRPPTHIVDEVKRLVGSGVLEVTLLGQTINHYMHQDGGKSTSFAELLWRVHEEVPELKRLRFITSYPRDFSDEALDVMAAAPRICRYLHIPAQSGSNTMLRAMNRGYTVEQYDALLERARARMPDIRLAGDMIVGFQGRPTKITKPRWRCLSALATRAASSSNTALARIQLRCAGLKIRYLRQ